MIMRIVLIFSDLLFKYFHIIADTEKLSRGRGSEGYLSLLGGGVGSKHIFGVFTTLDVNLRNLNFPGEGGGVQTPPFRSAIAYSFV